MNNAFSLLPLLLALAGVGTAAQAQAPAAGDVAKGAAKAAMCIGCHGIVGYQATFPEVHKVPMIAGQGAKYIAASLVAYQKEAAEVLYNHFAPKPAPPALPSVELATLRSELAELKALVTGLASKPAPYPGGTIGPREASASVLGPLRALARQLSHIRGSKYRSALLKLDQRLRRLVSYPNDNGQTWARFPADRYGELTGAVGLLQADAQAEIKAHAERVAREAQLPIAG